MTSGATPIVKENINEELIIKLSKYSYLEYQLRKKKISEEVIERYYNHFKDKFIKNREDIFGVMYQRIFIKTKKNVCLMNIRNALT